MKLLLSPQQGNCKGHDEREDSHTCGRIAKGAAVLQNSPGLSQSSIPCYCRTHLTTPPMDLNTGVQTETCRRMLMAALCTAAKDGSTQQESIDRGMINKMKSTQTGDLIQS